MPKLQTDEIFPSLGETSVEVLVTRLNDIFDDIQDVFNSSSQSLDQNFTISSTPYPIPGLPVRGAGMLLVFGDDEGSPSAVFTCVKSNSTASGIVDTQSTQNGTGTYAGQSYTATWGANESPSLSITTTSHKARVQWIGN